jgi:hypothetical protein
LKLLQNKRDKKKLWLSNKERMKPLSCKDRQLRSIFKSSRGSNRCSKSCKSRERQLYLLRSNAMLLSVKRLLSLNSRGWLSKRMRKSSAKSNCSKRRKKSRDNIRPCFNKRRKNWKI